ncbi:MAG: hypothetical protein ACYCWW_19835, partial [Deltaproteobacteria bacterium]
AFYAVKGFMDASERETIPNLTLQKLLVLLIRVGAARGFLEVLHGENSVSNIVDIQFDLKGAVPKIHTGPRRRADSEEWLVQYLRRRGVLERKGSQGPIRLGRPVDGSFLVADAPQQAQELGAMLGLLSKPSAEYPTLSARELTILASVEPPRDALAALEAELQIVGDDYRDRLRGLVLASANLDPELLLQRMRVLIRSDGYEATHSGRMKFQAFVHGEHAELVEALALRLASTGGVAAKLLADRWRAYWASIATSRTLVEERREVTPLILTCGSLIWELAAGLMLAETAMSGLAGRAGVKGAATACQRGKAKLEDFCTGMSGAGLNHPPAVARTLRSLRRGSPEPDYRRAVSFAYESLEDAVSRIPAVLDAGEQVLARRAGLSGRRDYTSLLWYDLIDSTATKAGRAGTDVELHGAEIAAVRRVINRSLQSLVHIGRKRDTEVHAWNGDVNSLNDEKHVFFGGPAARPLMVRLFNEIGLALLSSPGVRLRVVLCDAAFTGAAPYRYDGDSEVRGSRFWEHFSRVRKALREIEDSDQNRQGTLVSLVGKRMFASPGEFRHWRVVSGPSEHQITSEAQFLERQTEVRILRAVPTP